MSDKFQALRDALKAGPRKWDYDSNQTSFYNDAEGHSRGGECDGTYCLFGEDFFIEGERYDGPMLSEHCSKADAQYIAAANPATITALLADLDAAVKAKAQAIDIAGELTALLIKIRQSCEFGAFTGFTPEQCGNVEKTIDATLSQIKAAGREQA
jgi:hypothetical protein